METTPLSPNQAREAIDAFLDRQPVLTPEEEAEYEMSIARSLRRFRDRYNLKQGQVARALDISQPQLSAIETASRADRPQRRLTVTELLKVELLVKRSGVAPDLRTGAILRDSNGPQGPVVASETDVSDAIAGLTDISEEAKGILMESLARARREFAARSGGDDGPSSTGRGRSSRARARV